MSIRALVIGGTIAMLSVGAYATPLFGQTLLSVYDTLPDFSRYRFAEECVAAVGRVSQSEVRARPEFPDTMPFREGEGRDSTPSNVIATARACAASFDPDSVVLTGAVETFADWMHVYLTANRDDAAAVVARRRIAIAQQQVDTPQAEYNVLRKAIEVYGAVRPIRWDKIEETLTRLEEPGVSEDSLALWSGYRLAFGFASQIQDTVRMTAIATRMLALGEFMPAHVKNNRPMADFILRTNFRVAGFLTRVARMDSLRRGPDAYLALMRTTWENVSKGFPMSAMPRMLGKEASPVVADFWFTSSTGPMTNSIDSPRPAPGQVSLVVFLRQGCSDRIFPFIGLRDRASHRQDCWQAYASLRRLGARYPWLEITVVSRTEGYSGDTGPMLPRDEATVMQKWWLGFHRLPATLAVANTKFFRLQDPDRRRIDEPVSNDVNYLGGGAHTQRTVQTGVRNMTAFLVDTNGKIIESGSFSHSGGEFGFRKLLDIVAQRR